MARRLTRGRKGGCLPVLIVVLLLLALAGMGSEQKDTGDVDSAPAPIEVVEPQPAPSPEVEPDEPDDGPATTPETEPVPETPAAPQPEPAAFDLAQVPPYSGSPYVDINGGAPSLTPADAEGAPAESYAPLDALGRCGTAVAVVSLATMPTAERESIGMVQPSGWQTVRYDDLVDGRYLYNRCHLVGYQLTAENANERNLITGTRYLNIEGMLPFENRVAAYVERTGNRVIMRSTPVFSGNELVCRGVHMEALSVEDNGAGISFNIFCYNVQPGVVIDYATGDSHAEQASDEPAQPSEERAYVLNTNTMKFHYPDCSSVGRMAEHNKREVVDTREDLIAQGYDPCGICAP